MRTHKIAPPGEEQREGEGAANHPPPVSFWLPFPISVNSAYRNVPKRGRVKTKRYKDWQAIAHTWISLRKPAVHGPFHYELRAIRPDKRKRDLDNLHKTVLDTLQLYGVIQDDSLMESLYAEWVNGPLLGRYIGCMVTLREAQ